MFVALGRQVGKGFLGLPSSIRAVLEARMLAFDMSPLLDADALRRVLRAEPPRNDGGNATADIMRVWETQVRASTVVPTPQNAPSRAENASHTHLTRPSRLRRRRSMKHALYSPVYTTGDLVLTDACTFLWGGRHQVDYLEESLELFEVTEKGAALREWDGLQRLKRQMERMWLERTQLMPLDDGHKLRVSAVMLPHT
jgi:hypothetical protein